MNYKVTKYTYERIPLISDVLVVHDNLNVLDNSVAKRLSEYGDLYGFSCKEYSESIKKTAKNVLYSHLITHINWCDLKNTLVNLSNMLDSFDTISISIFYPTEYDFHQSSVLIDKWKNKFNGKINFLMPVKRENDSYSVPIQKILDNSVCDTVRIKYIPKKSTKRKLVLTKTEVNYFKSASKLFEKHQLYFRSPSDGYIALRRSTEEGFLITATKTIKTNIDLNRVSWVHSYGLEQNTLVYNGTFFPSSDAVEAAIIFNDRSDIKSIIHTHASTLFTRNKKYTKKIKIPFLPYGTEILGERLLTEIPESPDFSWLIMEDHGEVFHSGSSTDILVNLDALCQSERSLL